MEVLKMNVKRWVVEINMRFYYFNSYEAAKYFCIKQNQSLDHIYEEE
jgi:hypothetical protein